jgi:hypothetical protein
MPVRYALLALILSGAVAMAADAQPPNADAPAPASASADAKKDPQPLSFGKAEAVPAERVKLIQAELAKRLQTDQGVRTGTIDVAKMQAVDAENTTWLKRQVTELGWIDCKRFGAEASNSAFLIVQHSGDLPLMIAALPEIEKDAKAKLVDAQGYTLLYDRTELYLGRKQRYGTQISVEEGKLVVQPLQDRAKVEEFRKEVGLFPLSTYLDMIKQQVGNKPVVYADDEPSPKR